MAENKKSIIIYADWVNTIDKLSDEEAGKVFKHFLNYVNDKNPIAPDKLTEIVFEPIKQQLKRDLMKWEIVKNKRSMAGKQSALSKALKKAEQNSTHVQNDSTNVSDVQTSLTHVEKTSTKSTVNVNVNVNDNVINNNNKNIGDVPDKSGTLFSDKENDVLKINFDALLEHINLKTKRKFKLIHDKTKLKFKSLLKQGYSKKDIENAISNAVLNKYHIENNYQYLTPEFFSRASTLDKYSNVSEITKNQSTFVPKTEKRTR